MKAIVIALFLFGLVGVVLGEDPVAPRPDAATLKRIADDDTVIGIVHFSVNTFTDCEWGYGSEDPKVFSPTAFDAEQIVGACAAGGIKGLVVVAKHHDGFCLWPTKTTDHNILKSPFRDGKGDYVKEMSGRAASSESSSASIVRRGTATMPNTDARSMSKLTMRRSVS